MTIHASKGLEFEAVFLPSLDYEIEKAIKISLYMTRFQMKKGKDMG
ncbi:hypothetical protein [Caloramator sp. mosi_1]